MRSNFVLSVFFTVLLMILFTPLCFAAESIAITGVNISPSHSPLQPGDGATVSVNASASNSAPIYYKFYYCGNYGTSDYANTSWTTVQDYSTTNNCNYTFPSAGSYIVVVRAVTDPANEPAALPIVGGVVTVGGSADTVNISSFTSSATPSLKAGESVDLSLSASTTGGNPVSYKFYYCANYGTADYSNTPWTTVQEYSNSSSCRYTFPNAGNYIVVARAVTNPSNEPAALPIFGGVITVNPQSDAASAFAGNYTLNIYTDPKLSDGLALSTSPTTLTVTDTNSNSIGIQLSSATNESFNANLSISGDIAQISSKQSLSNTSTLWDCVLLSNGNNMALAYNTFSGHFPEGNMSIQVANWVKNNLSVNADSFVGTWKGSFYTNTNISGYNSKLGYTNTIDAITITKISNDTINLGFIRNGINESIQLKVADGHATLQSPVTGNDLAWQACSIATDGIGLSIYLLGSELDDNTDISLIMGLAKKQ